MNSRTQMRDTFDSGKAWRIVEQTIRDSAEYQMLRGLVLAHATKLAGRAARGGVAGLRRLGGFSEILRREIEQLPPSARESRGSKMYPLTISSVMRGELPALREALQTRVVHEMSSIKSEPRK